MISGGPTTTVKQEEQQQDKQQSDDAAKIAEQLDQQGESKTEEVEKSTEEPAKETPFNEDAFAEITDKPHLFEKKPEDKEPEDKEKSAEDESQSTETTEDKETKSTEKTETEESDKSTGEGEDELPPTARPPATEGTGDVDELELTEVESKLVSQMSNNAKDYFKSKLKELKGAQSKIEVLKGEKTSLEESGAGKLPANWYEHEDAYLLDPGYAQATQQIGLSQDILGHFTKHRVKQEASTTAEAHVLQRISAANAYLQQQQGTLEATRQNFKEKVTGAFNRMKETEDKYFPQYAKEEDQKKNEDIQTIQSRFKQQGLDKNILANFTAKMYAFALQTNRELQEKNKEIDRLTRLQETKSKVEPSSKEVKGGGKTTILPIEKRPFMADKFDAIKAGY
jgi:hypothetical protein